MKFGSLNINGMTHKGSVCAGGRSVSMIAMLVFLLAALLVLPSCFDDDEKIVEVPGPEVEVPGPEVEVEVEVFVCPDGTRAPENDVSMCDDEYDQVYGETDADNRYEGGHRDDMIAGTDNDDFIDAGGGNDSVKGMGGNDDIKGGDGNDMLMGGIGNDKLDGGAGNDDIEGNEGDDELIGGAGNNTLDGGEGLNDIVVYKDFDAVNVDLSEGTATAVPEGATNTDPRSEDKLMGIENVKGSHGDDTITGNGEANLLKGLDGADTINGGDGDDTILPNRPANVAADGTKSANYQDPDPDNPGSFNAADDKTDTINGGEGIDTISYEGEGEDVIVDLSLTVPADPAAVSPIPVVAHIVANVAGKIDYILVTDMGEDEDPQYESTIENVTGGFGSDNLTGDHRANRLEGGGGDAVNTLKGLKGNDTLIGGDGNDGLGDADSEEGDDTLEGGAGNDTLNGGPGDDTLTGGPGKDTLNGGPGSDMIYADQEDVDSLPTIDAGTDTPNEENDVLSFTGVTKDTKPNTADVIDGVTVSIGDGWGVEEVHGSPLDDTITGHSTREMILGGDGDDTLNGGGACNDDSCDTDGAFDKGKADVLAGQEGNDTLVSTSNNEDVFVIHNTGAEEEEDKITDFEWQKDHVHFIGFSSADCNLTGSIDGSGSRVMCEAGSQTVVIENASVAVSGTFSQTTHLNIVVEAPSEN